MFRLRGARCQFNLDDRRIVVLRFIDPRRNRPHAHQVSGEIHLAFRRGGRKAINKVMRTQPAVFLKLLVLLVPRELQMPCAQH
jgi:hypothetical protein